MLHLEICSRCRNNKNALTIPYPPEEAGRDFKNKMKILLLGEYSNVHNTLAEGLRTLGHDVCVASNGDFWKNYPRDIDLKREPGLRGTLSFLWRLAKALPKMRGYDVVQIINPIFLELKAERLLPIYKYLRRNNKKMILGAFGMDYYWVHVNDTIKPLRYSDFNFGNTLRHDAAAEAERKDWIGTAKQTLNEYIAHDCDAINAGLYEYYATYTAIKELKEKVFFMPYPIKPQAKTPAQAKTPPPGPVQSSSAALPTQESLKIFIGISKSRHKYKGTDIMLSAAEAIKEKYPDKVELKAVTGVPFKEYQKILEGSDCILDQLYAYTPAMNALMAMSKGIIVVGGGEEENYEILKEKELRPIVNVQPTYESCYHELEQLVLHPETIPVLKEQSVEYILKHHEYTKVAKTFIEKQASYPNKNNG